MAKRAELCLTCHLIKMGWYIRQQGQVSRPLDGYRQSPLVPGTNTGFASRRNLPSIGNELLQL